MGFTPDDDSRPPLPSQRPDNYTKPIKLAASKIENVDAAMIDFVKGLKLSANKSSGFEEVPVIWVSPERAYSSKRDQLYRDKDGTLIYPIISVERSSVRKDLTVKGTVWANVPPVNDEKGGSIQVARRIKQDKTSNFQNAHAKRKRGQLNFSNMKSKRIVYETVSMPIPVYVEVTYKIILRSEYQQQMNDLITPFITKPGGVNYIVLRRDGHTYEGFIQPDYRQNNNFRSFTREERKLETEIEIKVLAYLIGQGANQDQPTYVVRENAVEVKIPRERIILDDKPEHTGGRYYGLAGVIRPRKSKKREIFEPFETSGIGGGVGPASSARASGGGGGADREYQAGTGIILNGNEFSADSSVVAYRNGTTFTGQVDFTAGLRGSLTQLTDGSQFVIGGHNINILTGAAGQITISSDFNVDFDSISGSLATYHRISGSTATLNLLDADRAQIAQLSGSTATYNKLTVRDLDFTSLSGALGTIHNLSSSEATFNFMDADRVEANQLTVAGGVTFSGLANAVAVSTKYLALDSNNNVVLTGAAGGPSLAISGSSAVYHNISGSEGTFNLIDADRVEAGEVDFTSLSGSTGTIHNLSSSAATFNLLDADRVEAGEIDFTSLSGSTGTIHNLSSSAATFNLLDADRIEAGEVDTNSISATGDLNFTGLASGTPVAGKFLALDASNNVILTTAAGSEANFTSISGSTLTYHNMSGSSMTLNLLDSDRAEINDLTFTGLSGSTGTIHNLSSSAATFNLLDADRAEINDFQFTTFSGSTGTVHNLSSSAATFNLLDADRVEANDINFESISGSTAIIHNLSSSAATFNLLDADRVDVSDLDFTSISGSTGTIHNLSSSAATFNLLDSDRAEINDLQFTTLSGSVGTIHNLSSSAATFNLLDSDRAEINDIQFTTFSGSVGTVHNLSSSAATFNLLDSDRAEINDIQFTSLSGSTGTIHNLSSSAATFNLLDADRVESNQIDIQGGAKFTGLASATAVSTKYLALDSNNNVVLTSSSPVVNLFVTGSEAIYHNISASAVTINLLDSDRAEINDLSFTSLSGSTGTIHNLSSSAATFNLLDADRVQVNDLDFTSLSGSIGTIHNLSSSAVTSNLLDTDRIEARDITGTGEVTLTGLSSGTPVTGKFLALDSSDNVILTSGGSGGGDGTIGAAEDGDYSDGLFTDFTSNTLIGVPIDRFNEVLKILAPSPAPDLRSIDENISHGVTAKLSFGSSKTVPHYSSSATAAGFSAVDINGSYSPTNSGRNLRIGIYDGTQDITGILNDNVAANITNTYVAYASGAFGNAEVGTLKLELNGNIIHSIDLSEFNGAGAPASGTDSSLNADTSGFTNVSLTASSFDGNNAEWNIFKHRTGRFKADVNSMVPGWNYLRVIHSFGGSDKETNYIEWINDPSGSVNNLSVANERIEDITLIGSKFLSGVEYNTDATANYKVDLSNMYQNVYQDSGTPISFTVTNSTTPSSQAVPAIDHAGGEDSTKVLNIVAALDVNVNSLLNGAITANITATHPLKSTLSNAGSATTGNGFLIDNRTLASTNLVENFHDETYRKVSASYDLQAEVTNGDNEWNSMFHMTSSGATGHTDGLLYFNQRLYSPVDGDIPNGGNFSGLSNVEPEQPDYSGVTGTRTFYRVLSNSSGVTKRDLKIVTNKSSTTFNNSSLSTANARLYVKIPGQTGWMDASQDFVYGRIGTKDGALISGASNDTDSGNNTHHLTFGTASVPNGDHIMIKLDADESWAGYISKMTFTLGATTNTAIESLALDDIDMDNSGVSDARLSFGASHTIPNYSSATGSSISLTNFDTNGNYTLSGDRRGVFGSTPTVTGKLNEDVGSNGNNYPADSFKDALDGSLVLEVNGSEVHTVDISSTVNAITNDLNGNSSGFSVSSVNWSTTTDNIPDYTKPYRTGTYTIGVSDQRLGWNYARVIHRTSGGDVETNYVEWVVDTDSNALSASNVNLSRFDHPNVFRQSGVGYFATRPTASYTYTAANVYRNVYQQGNAVSFPTTTNCSISNIRFSGSGVTTKSVAASTTTLADLNNIGNCHVKDLEVTGTALFDSLTSIVEEFGLHNSYNATVTSRIIHPLKSTLNTASRTKSNFMVYSGSLGSTNLNTEEYFNIEEYRIVSGTYNNQADPIDSANKWNSSLSVNDNVTYPTHADGLAFVNGYLVSPKKLGVAGDTRNVDDGGTLQAPAENPNYSTLANATRTFVRFYRNNTTNDRSSITITMFGSGSMVKRATSLGVNGNFYLDAKIPGKTAWLDVGTAFASNNPNTDGAGALDGADPGNPAVDITGGGTSVVCNFNGESLIGTTGTAEYVLLRITADEDWLGYLSRLRVAYS